MSKLINSVAYYSAGEVAEMAGVHRLTLLRWIRERKLADADRDRNGWRMFSEEMTKEIVEFAKSLNQRSSPNQKLLLPRSELTPPSRTILNSDS